MHSAGEGLGETVIAWKGYDVIINGMQLLKFFASSKRKELVQKRIKGGCKRYTICFTFLYIGLECHLAVEGGNILKST